MTYKRFREVANFIKKAFIFEFPLSIVRVPLGNNLDGQCELRNKKFLIKINKTLSEEHAIDVVLHECAHAISWEKEPDPHGPNWGRTYSSVYRKFLEDFLGKDDQ
jgi:hypothetical protein